MDHYKRKLGTCSCDNCGTEFEKPQSEILRNKKLGRQNFCSRTCVGLNNIKNFGDGKNKYDISKHSGWKKDEFTKFRYHFRNIKSRNKEVNITLEDLRDVWDTQQETCPYLGIKLILNSYSKIKKDPITSASLDRIDSSKGYVKGNIQWISRAVNLMKNDMSENELLKIFELIIEKGRGSK
jgi:hypothetical protein